MTRNDLIEVFKNTRKLSLSVFESATRDAVLGTSVVVDGSLYLDNCERVEQNIQVIKSGTIQACLDSKSSKIAALNFADPYTKGGLVLDGEYTQEECICRCSNLYETLSKADCKADYYDFNSLGNCEVFSDRCIYSRDVLVFKDENYNLLDTHKKVDIITSPAPVCCNDISVFEKRIKCILGCAYHNGVDTIILGAWGCGAFGNNPELVATAFKNVLDEYKLFKDVIFAIRCTDNIPCSNFEIFSKILN